MNNNEMSTMIFCESWWDAISEIPERNHLRLCTIAAILNYGFYEITPEEHWEGEEVPSEVKSVFLMAKPFIDRNRERYLGKIKKNQENDEF